ncbi:MAG: trypsin-like peptidase domain-containing protein, partial [Gammaproteobacteria bacterium]
MKHRRHPIRYYANWILIGVLVGIAWLIFSGQGHLSLFGLRIGQNGTQSVVRSEQLATTSFANAVDAASPAVVSIRSLRFVEAALDPKNTALLDRYLGKTSPHAPKIETRVNSGSGVIIDARGFVLTNYHVIAETENLQVTLNDGRSVKAELVGKDPDTDLAVLKIELDELPEVKVAEIDNVRIGDVVLA